MMSRRTMLTGSLLAAPALMSTDDERNAVLAEVGRLVTAA